MEILSYVRLHVKALVAAIVLGVLAIIGIGVGSAPSGFGASVEMIISPPQSEIAYFASDLDRYINSELNLVDSPAVLQDAADEAGTTPEELEAGLTTTHEPGSNVALISVAAASAPGAVTRANAIVDAYLANARARASGPDDARREDIRGEIEAAEDELRRVNTQVARAQRQYANQNPTDGVLPITVLDPQLASRQSLSSARVQQLLQQQLTLDSSGADRLASRVVSPATTAQPLTGWGPLTYATAIVGLLLVLATVAAVGFSASRRVLSPARWREVTAGVDTRRPRIMDDAEASGDFWLSAASAPYDTVLVCHSPRRTARLERRTGAFVEELRSSGRLEGEPVSLGELPEALAAAGAGSRLTLLLVDLNETTVDQAAQLADIPSADQSGVLPVLL